MKLKNPPASVMSLIFPLIRDSATEGKLKCKECGCEWSRTFAGYCKLCFNSWCEEMKSLECKIA
jgi:hypothetical protein